MKSFNFLGVLAALIFSLGWSSLVSAQIALIDVAAVFKAHSQFTQELDNIRAQAETLRANSAQMQQDLARKAEGLKELDLKSQEFRDAEANLAKEVALLENAQKNQIRQLMQAEAKLHFDVYQQVNQLIGTYCQEHEITLVLRFASDPLDASNPESIMQKVNSSIIFHQPGRDITQQIIALLPQAEPAARSADNSNR